MKPVLAEMDVLLAAFSREARQPAVVRVVGRLIDERRLFMVGWVRQGLLTRTADNRQFHRLVRALTPFPDVPIQAEDHVIAAQLTCELRQRGAAVQPAQALLWCMADRLSCDIYTLEKRWWALERLGAPLVRF